MKGKITQWNNDKGFGFITPDDNSDKIFFDYHRTSASFNNRAGIAGV